MFGIGAIANSYYVRALADNYSRVGLGLSVPTKWYDWEMSSVLEDGEGDWKYRDRQAGQFTILGVTQSPVTPWWLRMFPYGAPYTKDAFCRRLEC